MAQNSRGTADFNVVGDSLFQGKWSARGATNQAGAIAFAEYDTIDSSYTFLTKSGYLFTTKESAINWQLINPQQKFDNPVGFNRFTHLGKTYMNVVTEDGYIYHSSNGGDSWVSGKGMESIEGFATVQKMVQAGNGDQFILLEEKLGQADITLYESNDFGANFTKIKTFNSPINLAINNYDIAKPTGNDSVILMLYVDTFSIYNAVHDTIIFHSRTPAFTYREGRVTGSYSNQAANLYLSRGGYVYHYDNDAMFWNRKSQISFESSSAYSFSCSGTEIEKLFVGDNDFNKSIDTGKTWSIQNSLIAYLADKTTNLHPGINSIRPFMNVRGVEIFLISTNGGLYLSQNQLNTVVNLTSNNVQIGNYFDLVVLREEEDKLFTSTEFQGLHTFKEFNTDSTVNSDHVAWGSNFQIANNISASNLWAASQFEIGFVSSHTDRFYRATWKFSDSLLLGAFKPVIASNPTKSTEIITTGFYDKNDPDKKNFIYKLRYDGSDIIAEKMDKNFNLNFAKTEFITALEISHTNDENWYAITNEGNFYGSVDEGKTWKRSAFFTGLLSNKQFGSKITSSKTTDGLVYVGGKGSGNGSIFISRNFGKDFSLLGTGLKNTEVYDISTVNKDSLVFVATKDGPFVYSLQFKEWESILTNDIPNRDWTCVQALENENSVWFGTFGRGLWEFDYQYFKDTITSLNAANAFRMNLNLYPNPTSGKLTIQCDSKIESIVIQNVSGQIIKSYLLKDRNSDEISLESMEPGVYFLDILFENGLKTNRSIVKK